MSDKSIAYDILSGVELKEKAAQNHVKSCEFSIRYCKKDIKAGAGARTKVRLEDEERRLIRWKGEWARFTGQVDFMKQLIRKMK